MRTTRREVLRGGVLAGLGTAVAGAPGEAGASAGYDLLLRAAEIAARTSDELRGIVEEQQRMVHSRQLPPAGRALLTEQSRKLADLSSAMRDVEDMIRQAGRAAGRGTCA